MHYLRIPDQNTNPAEKDCQSSPEFTANAAEVTANR
jgi:hypothetical protein